MAVSIAQYVDLLFKKLQGVAKTANSTVKNASNESIASPAFLRGDIIWMQSDDIPSTAQAVSNISNARINGNSVECIADNTVPPIGGIYPTWLSNVSYWIPQEFGSTWLPKIYVGPSGAANIQATGTQIFAAGIGGVGEYYFDTQAGVLNFIGETIPSVLTAGNVVYISGYEYVGAIGVTNQPGNLTVGNLSITSTTANRVLYTNNDNFVVTNNSLTFDGASLVLTGTANVSANLFAGNVYSGGVIDAVGDVNGNNFNVTNELSVTGNAIIGGDLVVNGNLTYVNVTDLNVEDPIIGLGRGANNTPLTINDGKDRGEQLWYYSGSEKSAFIGYDDSTGNLLAAVDVTIANEIVTVNQFGTWQIGNLYGESALITGNVDAANISSTGNILAIGNVMAGNVISSGAVIGNVEISGNLTVLNLTVIDYFQGNIVNISNTISAMGTITGGNLVSNAAISAATTIDATGNITGGNLASNAAISAATTVDAVGNITGGNLITTGVTSTDTLETTGNALIGGNLIVNGNITYINIDDLRVEDPIIILGTGPNGAPLTVDDGLDRGIYMEYYTTGLGNAFVGFKNSSGNMVIANDVAFTANDVVGINAYGTLEAGNLYIQSAVSTGNVTGANLITNAGIYGNTANITGNLFAGNVYSGGVIDAVGNITGGNILSNGIVKLSNGAVLKDTEFQAIAFGNLAGQTTQGQYSVAVGYSAGSINQGLSAVAVGVNAGLENQGSIGVAVGEGAGTLSQGVGAIAVGGEAGYSNQGDNAIAIGVYAANSFQGNNSIAIGTYAGYDNQGNNSIELNATGANLNQTRANTFTVAPVRNDVANVSQVLFYNNTSKEITYGNTISIAGNIAGGNLITSGLITVVGNIIGSGAVFSGNVTSDTFIGNIIGNSGTVGNLTFGNTTISTQLDNGNITLAATGNSFVQIGGTYGLVVPVGTTAQRLATGNLTGTVRFNTDVSRIEVYDGTEWDQIVSGVTNQILNGDGSTVAFVLDRASTSAAALIMLNGVVQLPGSAYEITPSPGTNLVFTEAPAVGDTIDIRYL
jgi:hypothetical protein